MPTPNDEQLYLDATKEVDSGTQDPAIWAKAMALAEGDEEKARYRYITLRVEELSKASAAAPPEDPAPIIDSGDEGLRSAPDNRSSVESSDSPESKTDNKPIPEGWVPLTGDADEHIITPPPFHAQATPQPNPNQQPHPTDVPMKHRRWVMVLLIVAVTAAPFFPIFPLCLGIVLLALCVIAAVDAVLAFVSDRHKVSGVSRRLLRLPPDQKWASGLRVSMYGLIGLVLVIGGVWGVGFRAEQGEIAAAKAEQRRRFDSLPQPLTRLRIRMANARVVSLMAEAREAVENSKFDRAQQKIRDAIAVPHARKTKQPLELERQIANATDPEHIKNTLIDLSDEAFKQFQTSLALPEQLVSGYKTLDSRAIELARASFGEVAAARATRRAAAEKAAKEKRKVELEQMARREAEQEEREARLTRQREAAKEDLQRNLDRFTERLKAAGIDNSTIHSVSVSGDDTATIKVANSWHFIPYQIRLQAAQNLWKVWASIASPTDRDKASIILTDLNGNKVGGSRLLAGSLIWVKKD